MLTAQLTEKYRPRRLVEVVGQPAARALLPLVANPAAHKRCLLLSGPPGVGKSATAHALAHELGCFRQPGWETVWSINSAEFGMAEAKEWFGNDSPFRFKAPGGWHLLVLEEFEPISPQVQRALKDYLEQATRRWKLVVVATTNDPGKINAALMQRFDHRRYSSESFFAQGVRERLEWIWCQETDRPVPGELREWGWYIDDDNQIRFSMRLALDTMGVRLAALAGEEVAA